VTTADRLGAAEFGTVVRTFSIDTPLLRRLQSNSGWQLYPLHRPLTSGIHLAAASDERPFPWGATLPLFDPRRVALGIALPDKQTALQAIGQLAQRRGGPSVGEIARRLARREARGSTALGRGAALPHADVPRLRTPVAVYLRCESGIDFGSTDGIPVSDILALLVPRPATAANFELLGRLTRRFSHPALREELACCAGTRQVCEVLARWCWT
jgi:nitrogen PTS system EIIA component